ncbi:fumarylacetoacetate hydrolase family protein [Desulfobacula sp.]|uniref:fumarylacetoacetate hydrolase family protein n=1 Tax=Desulfobacula sp. TaxID=2593537 RepID=UPI0026206075|nr:fumarylacetoacetate hydrolase family protein [Desulfobacula sp.]
MHPSNATYGLCTYRFKGADYVGLVVKDHVWEINHALRCSDDKMKDSELPITEISTMMILLENWGQLLPKIRTSAAFISENGLPGSMAENDVDFLSPVPAPGKMINVGLNFYDHAEEMGMSIPDGFQPSFFWKGDKNCVIGASQKIIPSSEFVDWEAELAVVMGRKAKNVPVEQAMDYVAGFTCHNDITDRQLMMLPDGRLDFYSGKSRDTFGPLGPMIVPVEAVPHPDRLRIRCLLNGEVMQDSGADQMVWGPAQCISYLSGCTTLLPGDVIALGTGAGTGWTQGISVGPGELSKIIENMQNGGGIFLRAGDRITVDIPGVGFLQNEVANNES